MNTPEIVGMLQVGGIKKKDCPATNSICEVIDFLNVIKVGQGETVMAKSTSGRLPAYVPVNVRDVGMLYLEWADQTGLTVETLPYASYAHKFDPQGGTLKAHNAEFEAWVTSQGLKLEKSKNGAYWLVKPTA